MSRRRALMSSNIVWEWTPDKGLSGITMIASSGETPNYQLLSDALRLYGPNNSAYKYTGIGLTDHLDLDNFTVEVYYKNLGRQSNGSVNVLAVTGGAGSSSGSFGYAAYDARATTYTAAPVTTLLRGADSTSVDRSGPVQSSGVVKVHLNTGASLLKGSFPGGYTMTDAPLTAETINTRIAAVETNRTTYYADITRIVIRKGDTT